MQYKLHLNLQQRAALRAAISFWEKKEVKDKVTEFVKSCSKYEVRGTRNKWNKLTKVVVEEWEKDILPQKLEVELIHIVKMIGETIYNWYQYIKNEYGTIENPVNCIDQIHWTPYGTVDAVRIFKSSWLDNPNLDITKVYNFACEYVLEEHINDMWNKIPKNIQDNCFNGIFARFDRHMLAYWECYREDDLSELMSYFEDEPEFDLIYDLNLSIQENMLRLSVHQGYFIATKYFWEKLNEEEKNNSVLKCACIAVIRYTYYERSFVPYSKGKGGFKKSQYVEICIFLMNQMNKSHKKAFFNEKLEMNDLRTSYTDKIDVNDTILKMLLSAWPWQELFIPVFKDMMHYQDDNSRMSYDFLNEITKKIYEDQLLGYPIKMNTYRSLFRKTWFIVPASIKQKIVNDYSEIDFICNLVYVWDLDSLKLVLDDPEVAEVRDEYIIGGLDSYKHLVEEDQFDKLDQFIEEMIRSETDKKWFKKLIDAWFGLLLNDRLDLADKLLDWRCSTPEERKSTKNNIDHEAMCEYLIGDHKYELLEKFLDWKLETEEEKRNCKNYFKNDEYMSHIFNIWIQSKDNIEKAKEESSRYLDWMLESEEEIVSYKNEKSANFRVDSIVIPYLLELNKIGNINNFLSWFLLPEEEIQRIKQAVSQVNPRMLFA